MDNTDRTMGCIQPIRLLMALLRVGFFRELRHGDPTGPSLDASRYALPADERGRVARYLRGGAILAATGTVVGDWFDPRVDPVISLGLATDGTWVWPSDLAYYVERYGVGVPDELLQHMARSDWVTPQLTSAALLQAEVEFFRSSST